MSKDIRQEFIQGVLLEHCNCGMPESSLKYIQKLLNLLKDSESQNTEELNKFFYYDDGLKYTVYYMLHKYGLIGHINSVSGKITEEGGNLLDELNKLYLMN